MNGIAVMKGSMFATICFVVLLLPSLAIAQQKYANLRPSNEWLGSCPPKEIKITPLHDGRKLAIVCDTIYLLDTKDKVVWSWSSDGTGLSDDFLVDPAGRIYVTGDDNLLASIDLATGKERWQQSSNGTAPYYLVGLYDKDKFVLVKSYSYYRRYKIDPSARDVLWIHRGDDVLWETDLPNDAVIKIRGKSIFAVTKRKGKTVWRKLKVPNKLDKRFDEITQ